MRSGLAAMALLVLGACSSNGLTAAEALPFQACSQDQACVPDNLTCQDSCAPDVAVNRSQQQAFEQARGCWPPSSSTIFCDLGSCQVPRCAAGQCVLASDPFCGGHGGSTSSGFVTSGPGGTFGGPDITTGTSGSFGSSSSSGSGSVGASSGSGSSGGASAASGSGSGASSGTGSTGGSGTSGSGATT